MSNKTIWTGRVISGLTAAFLAFDAIAHIAQPDEVIKANEQIGFPIGALVPLGIVQLVCLALYLIPRTAVLGAVLWTGYLGGAVATLVHVGEPAAHLAFPLLTAVLVWGGLALRDVRVRQLVKSFA